MPPRWFPTPGGSSGSPSAPTAIQSFTSSTTSVITLPSAQAGDFIVAALYSNSPNLAGPNAIGASQAAQFAGSVAFGGGPPYLYMWGHQVNAQDVSGGNTFTFINSLGSFGAIAALLLRHTFGATDGFGTAATTASSASVAVNSFTTTLGGDLGIIVLGMQGTGNAVSAAPSGYTIGPNIAGTAGHQGAAILYNPALGTAGIISPGNVTMAVATGTTATIAFGLRGFVTNY